MHQFKKHFTLEEARALLPTLRAMFASIHKHKAALEQADEALEKQMGRTGGDLGGKYPAQLLSATAELRAELTRIGKLGIQIKDLDRGLVDFPSIRNGREVFLCWEL